VKTKVNTKSGSKNKEHRCLKKVVFQGINQDPTTHIILKKGNMGDYTKGTVEDNTLPKPRLIVKPHVPGNQDILDKDVVRPRNKMWCKQEPIPGGSRAVQDAQPMGTATSASAADQLGNNAANAPKAASTWLSSTSTMC
jgi:hypothetical protein